MPNNERCIFNNGKDSYLNVKVSDELLDVKTICSVDNITDNENFYRRDLIHDLKENIDHDHILLQKNLILHQQKLIELLSAKLGKSGKTESEDQDLKKLNKQTKYIKIFLLISFSLLILVGTILLIIFYTHDPGDKPLYPDPGSNQSLDNHQILDRSKWNGRPALRYETMETPVSLVIIKHTGGGQCFSFEVCAGKLQTIQSDAVGRGAADIYFSFLIGGDENIYVGRGWDVQPAQRNDMIDIAFMGSYTFDKPTSGMIDAAKLLLEDGVKNNKLTKDYKVVCHNQTSTTLSPGINLIKEVRTWEHYDPGTYFGKEFGIKSDTTPLDSCINVLYINRRSILYLGIFLVIIFISTAITLIIINHLKNQPEEYNYDYEDADYGRCLENHTVYYRNDWGGKPPKLNCDIVPLNQSVPLVIISHSFTEFCRNFENCSYVVQQIQVRHFAKPYRSSDIGYNFLIGGDGDIYVGRGWDVENFQRTNSIGINFIGNFNFDELNEEMVNAAQALIDQGLDLERISDDFLLVGENQTNSKMNISPGVNVYKIISQWPNFYNRTMF
ncbi:hypothetical protein NQ317_013700 [Molorchus minor]|uniref:Uncharacterized protein n=1 Tax=Molorchus minor TaxID=1323400 RepID=A0ABQ9JFW7_9CUCU|nr:hypothetical protein NQ317_013700 [Molorchus minor]